MELFHSKNKNKTEKKGLSTQSHIDVEEIKDDLVVLKNRSLRAVILVSSINFDLKATDEQEAIIIGYQNFLNALDFPLQIVISSKRLDINPYLADLEKKRKKQTNELMRLQISEYSNFVKELTESSQIMTKHFYIVVPFYPIESEEGGFLKKISDTLNPKQKIVEDVETFEAYKNQLWQRVDQIRSGLNALGLRTTVLKTEELVELLYTSYNPSIYSTISIGNLSAMEIEV